jgi:hypothetical protein
MKRTAILVSGVALFGVWFIFNSSAQRIPTTGTSRTQAADAAKAFLATLDDAQRSRVLFDFKDKAQRARWSNLPAGAFQRTGLRIGELTAPQREAAMAMLAAALSPQGYEKTLQIVEADEALRSDGGGRGGDRGGPGGRGDRGGRGGRRGGGGANFGHDLYFISLLGQPSATDPWILQFGGHHLGLNITFIGEQGTLSPSHTGAQPAIYEIEGKMIRPLGREVEKSFALIETLDEAQRKQAVLGFEVRDLVLGPGRDGQTIQPEGIKASSLSDKQQAMLLDLAGEWTGIMTDPAAAAKMAEMKTNIADTWFAWSGPTTPGSAAYFRIQGPTVHIEFAPQRMGGDATRHIHTIYRDPTNEYGAKWARP